MKIICDYKSWKINQNFWNSLLFCPIILFICNALMIEYVQFLHFVLDNVLASSVRPS